MGLASFLRALYHEKRRERQVTSMDERVPRSDEDLLTLVKTLSLAKFGLPFRHETRYNHRLRTTGGRYLLLSHDLEFNPLSVELHGNDELVGTILHELCHYHLHLSGKGYRHKDRDFQALLAQVGGARYAKPTGFRTKVSTCRYYRCLTCGQEYIRRRSINVNRWRCGRCRGKLTEFHQETKTMS
nr:SprT family protein [Bacilli bacterium]